MGRIELFLISARRTSYHSLQGERIYIRCIGIDYLQREW